MATSISRSDSLSPQFLWAQTERAFKLARRLAVQVERETTPFLRAEMVEFFAGLLAPHLNYNYDRSLC